MADDDPRLAAMDGLLWGAARLATLVVAEAWLIEWPDGALGFAILSPESLIAERLIAAYAAARHALELRVLTELTLETAASH